jgi:N-acetylglucosamine-6-sulfatase
LSVAALSAATLVGLAAFLLAGGDQARGQQPVPRPNIILIVSDDQRADTLAAMPQLRRALVARGMSFDSAVVSNSLCCPSRSTILTGNYSHTTNVYSNRAPFGDAWGFRHGGAERQTLPVWLERAGYRTALIGKYLNSFQSRRLPPGWNEWRSFVHGIGYYLFSLSLDGRAHRYNADLVAADYSTDLFARQALAFISKPDPRPFFLYVAPAAPHAPANPAPRHWDAFPELTDPPDSPAWSEADVSDKPAYVRDEPLRPDGVDAWFRRRQYQTLLAVDDLVGKLVARLGRLGKLKDTAIVYVSDQGVQWGEHRLEAAQKTVPYEGSIRVPLIVRYDRLTGGRARIDEHLVSNADLAPTLADLAGARHPRLEGVSLVPLLERRPTPAWRGSLLLENEGGLGPKDPMPTYCGVRADRYKFVLYGSGEEELYDLVRDPYELNNVAGLPGYERVRSRLLRQLRELCFPLPPAYLPDTLCDSTGGPQPGTIEAGDEGEELCSRSLRDLIRGGDGPDTIIAAPRTVAGAARATFFPWQIQEPAPGSRISAGEGDDRIFARNGRRDRVECGRGADRVLADRFDSVKGCERIELPHAERAD